MESLEARDFKCIDLTDNEAAKLHIRHLVGGRYQDNGIKERIFRFEFPEVPGASINFLETLSGSSGNFNISLFHYRSHGSDVGRVLAGFQVPGGMNEEFDAFI